MKVYISFDFEGVAGIVDWEQCREGGAAYALGCELMLGEVNAAIDGAVEGGADEIVVNDSHSTMRNLDPSALAHEVMYVSGRHKQHYMMQQLDDSFDVIFFVGYHGSISGAASTLSHTYNPEVFAAARVNGVEVGESGINALVADHYAVPIGLVTGDDATQQQTAPFARNAVRVVTKYSDSRFSAKNLHPTASRRLIRAGALEAVQRASSGGLARVDLTHPVQLDLDVQTGDMAEVGSWVKGAERIGTRTIRIESDDSLAAFESFVAVNYITRQAGGR
ncbi:M55 family metallopeptidase [Allobranchiibius sp. GilTou73]|uniref:M55 family metallopeptidase n=1 Tax=Allobranchiibius sp. GilTou73 TaxID=2904523 RepID=UPI001F2CA5EC|nr:M55 family metallopeptidase [Allobranchiibius sp. GilTou73]UIJ33770.1 M55 family metallopeptidase [Allobranchiibius sp. GilTou73]